MNFTKLDKEIQKEVIALSRDEEFQERFATDSILDQLESTSKDQLKEEFLEFKALLKIDKRVLTPVIWTYLWIVQSPLVNSTAQITEADLDFFLYLIDNGITDNGDCSTIFTKSIKYSEQIGINYEDAALIAKQIVQTAFRPLMLFPMSSCGSKPDYDLDWLTSVIVRVHAVTGYDPDYIINKMSMTEVCYYFAQYARMNGSDGIYKRTPEEILAAIDRRATELIVDRLIEKNVIKEESRNNFIEAIISKDK